MPTFVRHFVVALFALSASFCAAAPAVKDAATRFVYDIQWQEPSVLSADFACTGHEQAAILGTSKTQIVVAIFVTGLDAAPQLLRFASEDRKPDAAHIAIEDVGMDFKTDGANPTLPRGMIALTTCKGIKLSDGQDDAAHIYWDHQQKRFESWAP